MGFWKESLPLPINGVIHYLWRAVDQHGVVIDILVQSKRDRFAAYVSSGSCCGLLDIDHA
jgi:hypothetical protein